MLYWCNKIYILRITPWHNHFDLFYIVCDCGFCRYFKSCAFYNIFDLNTFSLYTCHDQMLLLGKWRHSVYFYHLREFELSQLLVRVTVWSRHKTQSIRRKRRRTNWLVIVNHTSHHWKGAQRRMTSQHHEFCMNCFPLPNDTTEIQLSINTKLLSSIIHLNIQNEIN